MSEEPRNSYAEYPEDDVLWQLRAQSDSRTRRWHKDDTVPWTGADWGNAMAGEAGEACNVIKKLRRFETGTGSQDTLQPHELLLMLARELGDVVAYCDRIASHYGIDLRAAVAEKFNFVSQREGFPERIYT